MQIIKHIKQIKIQLTAYYTELIKLFVKKYRVIRHPIIKLTHQIAQKVTSIVRVLITKKTIDKYKTSSKSHTQGHLTEMLTITKKEVSQVEKLVKQIDQIDPGIDYQHKELNTSSPKANSNKHSKDIILNASFFLKLLGKKLENNWQDQIEERKIRQLEILLKDTKEVIKTFEDSKLYESNQRGFGSINPKKELKIFKESLLYLSKVVSDTLEFVNIASEITELRSKQTTKSVSEEIEQILAKSKEVSEQKKELPKKELEKSMKCILEAMRKS